MFKNLAVISVVAVSTFLASAQTGARPKPYVFDEFRVTTKSDLIARTKRLQRRLHETAWSNQPDGAFLFFYFNAKKKIPLDFPRLIRETLYKDCLDCMGYDPRITFVEISDSDKDRVQYWIVPLGAEPPTPENEGPVSQENYPSLWFTPINDPNKPDWEILPQEAKAGEVILSKRNELGILSNFAATPFELDGKRYASVEGFWQMMLYPEGPDDERAKDKRVIWKYTRDQVAQMTAIEAKQAGTLAEENMKNLGINWVTFEGERFPYRSAKPGRHYQLITEAMRAKLEQNPEVRRILLATGDLKLRPDHIEEPNAPPEWHYYEIWMQLRAERQKQ